jgi:SH3-like domain-containing protein
MRRALPFLILLSALTLSLPAPGLAQTGTQSGLEDDEGRVVPRMVSIKATEANVRTGPGVDYPIRWVYRRMGMPVLVIAEFDKWRKIRDWEGDEGWVHHALVSARRTVIVTAPETTMRRSAAIAAPAVARLSQGMVARIDFCETDWCRVSVQGYEGWVARADVWGERAE